MGLNYLVIMNDVETELDKGGLLIGAREVPVTQQGMRDSVKFARHVLANVENVGQVLSSDSARVSRILHYLRLEFKHPLRVRETDVLRERDFGVLNGTSIKLLRGFQSDLFQHTRICAENGESVSQCAARVVPFIKEAVSSRDDNIVMLSHPMACNITFNSLLGRKLTDIYPFWLKKGSYVVLSRGDDLSPWFGFETAFNVIEDKEYSVDEIQDEFDTINNLSSPSQETNS